MQLWFLGRDHLGSSEGRLQVNPGQSSLLNVWHQTTATSRRSSCDCVYPEISSSPRMVFWSHVSVRCRNNTSEHREALWEIQNLFVGQFKFGRPRPDWQPAHPRWTWNQKVITASSWNAWVKNPMFFWSFVIGLRYSSVIWGTSFFQPGPKDELTSTFDLQDLIGSSSCGKFQKKKNPSEHCWDILPTGCEVIVWVTFDPHDIISWLSSCLSINPTSWVRWLRPPRAGGSLRFLPS